MDMKRLTGGNLRAAGYDDKNRVLVVELSSGTFQYAGVTAETWRRFAGASSPWSFFRDSALPLHAAAANAVRGGWAQARHNA
ncbi:MAG: KTSC domain-containing protein [Betaproteobacteria bacterium]|nr:MAG: KTSC domain-containing protein [Betaproteobacteria bacterium]